jgi:hypothetical protein
MSRSMEINSTAMEAPVGFWVMLTIVLVIPVVSRTDS